MSLLDEIRNSQIIAGEQAVVRNLQERGLIADIIPEATINIFHSRIENAIKNKRSWKPFIESLQKINGGRIPLKIQELLKTAQYEIAAKIKDTDNSIYAGMTLRILAKRMPTEYELEYGPEYKLSLIGTNLEDRYPSTPWCVIYAKDIERIIFGNEPTMAQDMVGQYEVDLAKFLLEKKLAHADLSDLTSRIREFNQTRNVNIEYSPND